MVKSAALIIACLVLSHSGASLAQNNSITILTTYNANGFASRTLQIMEPALEDYFNQPVEIQYGVGTELAMSAPGDGATLYVSTIGNMALLPSISASFGIDPLTDLQPVTLLVAAPDVLVAHSGLGISTLDELITYSQEHPGELSYSHIAPRSIHRVEFAALLDELGIDAQLDESMRGAARAMEGVANGAIDLVITTSPYVTPLVESGSVVPLAVAHSTRMPFYPEVPTLIERGVSAVPHGSWAGVFVPATTSQEDVSRILGAVRYAIDDPSVVSQINELGMDASLSESPEAFVGFIKTEMIRLQKAAEEYRIKID
jgi:tripartite-type tricarboxylate transporter receptor subunit TctC